MRFHEPPPFWGPKAKPKRKAEAENKCGNVKKIVIELGKSESEDEESLNK